MNKFAVIVAGGNGTRMGSVIPKQFLLINEKPLIYYSIKAFVDAFEDIQIIVVLPKEHFNNNSTLQSYFKQKIEFVEGGATRFYSVKNGLFAIENEGVVFVHDAVRCLLSPNLIKTCFDTCLAKGNAIPVIDCVDSMRQINASTSSIIDRNSLKVVQTPQTFFVKDLQLAFSKPYQPSFTDEASVAEASQQTIHLCEGESFNLKITTPIDLIVAENILNKKP
ncbi:MAG: 2-C-methyl-D-erythritol 4-phosphate cytidylyltransferase [Chitinophagaceae bacterium]